MFDKSFVLGWIGNWKDAVAFRKQAEKNIDAIHGSAILKALMCTRPWLQVWSGRIYEAEKGLLDAIETLSSVGHQDPIEGAKRDLAFVYGLQNKFDISHQFFQESARIFERRQKIGDLGSLFGFWGFIKARQGGLKDAMALLHRAGEVKQKLDDVIGFQEILNWQGLSSGQPQKF